MTITYGATGAQAVHTDTITPALVGAVGDLAILQVVSGHPSDNMPSTPSGWTLVGTSSGGGGTFGAGAGPRRLTWFARVLAGGESAPTTAIPTGSTGSVIAGRVVSLSRSAGTGWRWAATFGEDTVSDTSLSAVCATAITWTAGDLAVLGYAVASSADSYTAEAVTATGVTFGTVTERADAAITTGDGETAALATCAVSAGSGTQAPTVTATLAAASTGVAGVLRVREASSAIAASAQTVDPPRTLVSVTGMLADDIVMATIYRQVGTDLTAVRAASSVDVTGTDALLRVDAEQPFGVAVSYAADLTDVNGSVWAVSGGTITSTVASDIVSDAIRGVGAHVSIESWADKKRSRDATVLNCNGRLVVVGKRRSAAQATITVSTDTAAEGDALQDILDSATEGTVLIRAQTSISGVDGYLALLTDDERRVWTIPYREWDLETVETEAWPDVLEAAGYTLQDIADNYATLADITSAFPGTLLDIALFDFGG